MKNGQRKRLGVISFFLFTAASLVIAEKRSTTPIPREKVKQWVLDRYEEIDRDLKRTDLAKVNVVFIGDSITEHWLDRTPLWKEKFTNPSGEIYALNLGVGGDRTEHVLYRLMSKAEGGLGHLDAEELKPNVIVLMIGTNNLFKQQPDEITDGIRAVKDRLLELEPQAQVLLCSVLPAGSGTMNEEKVVPVNEVLRNFGDEPRVVFLDLYPSFIAPDGARIDVYFKDNLHPNANGYQVWYDRLAPVLQKMVQRKQ